MSDADAQLLLKKRARRRLVGAVAFVLFAAVVLPMVMDTSPPLPAQEVQIRIPGQEQTIFAPQSLSPAKVAVDKGEASVAPATPAPAVPAAAVAATAAVAGAAVLAAAPAVPAADKAAVKPAAAPAVKPAEKTPEKVAEKVAEKPVEKPVEKPAADKPVEKTADKSADKNKPAEKKADTHKSEADRAASILTGKPAAASSAPAGGSHVILIGAYANPGNVKVLRSKLDQIGVKTFTETLTSPQGNKIRLRAGPFANKEAADKALDKMKRIGVSGVVAAK